MQLFFKYPENYTIDDKEIFYFLDESETLPVSEIEIASGWWDVARTRILTFPQTIVTSLSLGIGRKKMIRLESATWVTNAFSGNYFHWINDVLPKLMLLQENGINCTILLLEDVARQSFVQDTLKALGWEYVVVRLNDICRVKKMFLPQMTAGEGSQHPVYFNSTRKALCGEAKPPKRKIFITREDSPYRNVIPREPFEQLMKLHGFEILNTSNLSIGQQIAVFSECSHLVAVHGAGLTNMAFMPEGKGKVLEIRRADDKLNYCYFKMANVLNHKYYYFLAAPEDAAKVIQCDNVIVDITSFERTLGDFLNEAIVAENIVKEDIQ